MYKSKEEKLISYLEELIKQFRQDSRRHKRLYRLLRTAAFALTALATVFSSAALAFLELQNWLNVLIVIATAASGFITAYEGLRQPAGLWVHERLLLHTCQDMKRRVEYEQNENGEVEKIDD